MKPNGLAQNQDRGHKSNKVCTFANVHDAPSVKKQVCEGAMFEDFNPNDLGDGEAIRGEINIFRLSAGRAISESARNPRQARPNQSQFPRRVGFEAPVGAGEIMPCASFFI
ncbi:MAG: hypothetical protein ACREOO_24910 [bacterium]